VADAQYQANQDRRTLPDALACHFSVWSPPVELTELNSPAFDHSGWLARDNLTILFTSARNTADGSQDIYIAHRPAEGRPFGAPVKIGPPVSGEFDDVTPSLTPDGRVLFFASDRDAFIYKDIYMVRREDVTDDQGWRKKAVRLGPDVNTDLWENSPKFAEGEECRGVGLPREAKMCLFFKRGDFLYAAVADVVVLDTDSWVVGLRSDFSTTGPAVRVNDVSQRISMPNALDGALSVRRDGLEAYVALWNDGVVGDDIGIIRPEGLGGGDIYVTTRNRPSDPWGAPVLVGAGINSATDSEDDPNLSFDGKTLIFDASRDGVGGTGDPGVLLMSTRTGGCRSSEGHDDLVAAR
jgi:hypothetical protein